MDSDKKKREVASEEVTNGATTDQDIQEFFQKHRFLNNASANSSKETDSEDEAESTNSVKVNFQHIHEKSSLSQEAVNDLRKSVDNYLEKAAEEDNSIVSAATPVVVRRRSQYNQYLNQTSHSQETNEEVEEAIEEESSEMDEETQTEEEENEALSHPSAGTNSSNNSRKTSKNKKEEKKKNEKVKKKKKPKKKNKLFELIKKHPWVFIIICIVALIILVVLAFAMAFSDGGGGTPQDTYLDPKYDYNRSVVYSTDTSDETVIFETLLLEDLAKGATYAALYNKANDLTDSEKHNLYVAYLITIKSRALDLGNYTAEEKELTIKSGTGGIGYCDIYNGCNVYENGSIKTYVSTVYTGTLTGTLSETIPAISEADKNLLDSAWKQTEYQILTIGEVKEAIIEYPYSIPDITETIVNQWVANAQNGMLSLDIIRTTTGFGSFQLYDIQDYAPQLISPSNGMYWWPIGSAEADENGLYSGEPTATTITAHFAGNDSVHNGKHGATDIGAAINKHVIIASRSGTVKVVKEGCDTVGGLGNKCNGGGGNYVIITHDDGAETTYMHMAKGSIVVKVGDYVVQGQKIGMSGSSGNSTGGHLHFALKIDGTPVDPEEYISAENPRQSIGVNIQYVAGSTTKETVCKTLKASNFNTNAVAALMTNIQAESSFNIGAEGDNGTSYGLCQWHNGRKSRLKEYCGANYNTAECQLDYLMHELKNSYKDVYQNLIADGTSWNMANYFCVNFERPANTKTTCANRANKWVSTFDSYVQNNCKEVS